MTQLDATKKCPYCAETIKAVAVVCRYCSRDLATGQFSSMATPAPEQQSRLLNERIENLTAAGWQVINRTLTTAQLKKPKQWNHGCLIFCVLFLAGAFCGILFDISLFLLALGLAIIGLLIAAADYALKTDQTVYLTEEKLSQELQKRNDEQKQREEQSQRREQERLEKQSTSNSQGPSQQQIWLIVSLVVMTCLAIGIIGVGIAFLINAR